MTDMVSSPQRSRIPGETPAEGPLVGAARTVETTARHLKEKVIEKKEEIAHKNLGDLASDGREWIKRNPGTTILVSVGVGAVVGYLLGRRRS
jgi:ElaB/YqjD/DUF883 family membrane-anchored ribosome-binding protein